MIKAGSLLYAVYICLLISILSGALIFIFNFNLEFSARQSVQSELIDRCDSCSNYYFSNSENFESLGTEQVDLFGDGVICEFSKSKWGVYTILNTKTFFKNDTIEKKAFIGETSNKNTLALYLCDWGEELKVSGSTSIKGNMKLPAKRHKTINILGNNKLNKPVLSGNISISGQVLPKLFSVENSIFERESTTTPSKIRNQSIVYNDFKNPPLLLDFDKGDRVNNLNIKGNIILRSNDTLYIESTSKIEDAIIKAPKVIVQRGFRGTMQIFADKEVLIEENVILKYPSNITITSGSNQFEKKISILKNSSVYGGVIIDGRTFDQKESNAIHISEDAVIFGDLYCNGILQLQGKVIGTVYVHKLKLETKSGTYENVLLNSYIDALSLPNNFIRIPLFSGNENRTYGVIKEL